MRVQGYCDVYKLTILKRTSPEVKCLHPTSSRREMCTLSVSNVIYHKFSHGAAFYMLNGKNVNVMLEFMFVLLLVTAYGCNLGILKWRKKHSVKKLIQFHWDFSHIYILLLLETETIKTGLFKLNLKTTQFENYFDTNWSKSIQPLLRYCQFLVLS